MKDEEQDAIHPGLWRQRLKKVPGLVPLYRALKAGWRRTSANGIDLQKKRVAGVWGDEAIVHDKRAPKDWLESSQILWQYVFPQFGGVNWYHYVAQHYCPSPRRMGLSLCCGDGHVERDFIKYGICQTCEGIDISPAAIEICRRQAASAGFSDYLHYRLADLERIQLPRENYDLAVSWMALHHLCRLRHVFGQMKRALKPDGIFIVNEYVGPVRFQVPDRLEKRINVILKQIPPELRRLQDGSVKETFARPELSEIVNHDPSEAICSDQIMPELRRCFDIVECINYGGTILNWLLHGIVQNFNSENSEHRACLERLYAAERTLLESGEFESYFAFVIAKKPTKSAKW